VPAGVWLTLRFVSADVLAELRAEAARRSARPVSRAGAAAIVVLWLAGAALLLCWILGRAS
jgi:hypothetical protein